MSIEQIIALAIVQGITEFLPISSSGHLAIFSDFTGYRDQGLAVDVMMHVGSLFAIIVYFWSDVVALIKGTLELVTLKMTERARLALYIALATIPAGLFGIFLKTTGFMEVIRADDHIKLQIVGWNAIVFGLVLYLADRFGARIKSMANMKLSPAMMIGLAQALALIPGTSRSGITISAARALGFHRTEAARFSFLLGIPAIAAAGLLTVHEAYSAGEALSFDAWLAAGLSFMASLAAIAFLMAIVKRMSFAPFVLYRLALGIVLLYMAYG